MTGKPCRTHPDHCTRPAPKVQADACESSCETGFTGEWAEFLERFRGSFYSVYFQDTEDFVITAAADEVGQMLESQGIKRHCPRIYDRYLVLKTILFLNTMRVNTSMTEEDGEEQLNVQVQDLNTPSGVSFVQTDRVNDVTRSYHAPADSETHGAIDVPLGMIKDELSKLMKACVGSKMPRMGIGSGRPGGQANRRCLPSGFCAPTRKRRC